VRYLYAQMSRSERVSFRPVPRGRELNEKAEHRSKCGPLPQKDTFGQEARPGVTYRRIISLIVLQSRRILRTRSPIADFWRKLEIIKLGVMCNSEQTWVWEQIRVGWHESGRSLADGGHSPGRPKSRIRPLLYIFIQTRFPKKNESP
jgi:hypothetical protein